MKHSNQPSARLDSTRAALLAAARFTLDAWMKTDPALRGLSLGKGRSSCVICHDGDGGFDANDLAEPDSGRPNRCLVELIAPDSLKVRAALSVSRCQASRRCGPDIAWPSSLPRCPDAKSNYDQRKHIVRGAGHSPPQRPVSCIDLLQISRGDLTSAAAIFSEDVMRRVPGIGTIHGFCAGAQAAEAARALRLWRREILPMAATSGYLRW